MAVSAVDRVVRHEPDSTTPDLAVATGRGVLLARHRREPDGAGTSPSGRPARPRSARTTPTPGRTPSRHWPCSLARRCARPAANRRRRVGLRRSDFSDDGRSGQMNGADWIALAAAVISLLIAVASFNSAHSAKTQVAAALRQASAAEAQVDEAKRASLAAEDSAATARQALQSMVDFTPVLIMRGTLISPDSEYPWLEVRWTGPKVIIERVLATKWCGFDARHQPIAGQLSANEVALQPSEHGQAPMQLSNGERRLFDWPGPPPGPGGLAAEVRVDYRLGNEPYTLTRDVEIAGYGGFRS